MTDGACIYCEHIPCECEGTPAGSRKRIAELEQQLSMSQINEIHMQQQLRAAQDES